MGKIRIKTLGDEEAEQEKQRQAKIKKEQKQAKEAATAPVTESKKQSNEPVIASKAKQSQQIATSQALRDDKKKPKKKKFAKKKTRSKSYQTIATLLDRSKSYPIVEAIGLLEKLKRAKFDETVELHVNTIEAGISGSLQLPHGTGKKIRVAIADPTTASGQVALDELLKKVESGVIEFDVLLSIPAAMPKLAKVARVLGPKGLMPNPKNGTVTANPETAAKKFEAGLSHFKTEAKNPIIHLSIGKISFGEKKLAENVTTALNTINTTKITSVTLKSTMSPGIKLQFASL